MAPLSVSFVGYHTSREALNQYCKQHNISASNNRPLLQHLESDVGVPLTLVSVEHSIAGSRGVAGAGNDPGLHNLPNELYISCFTDYNSQHEANVETLVPPKEFSHLKDVVQVDGDVKRLFAPRAELFSYDAQGRSRITEKGPNIGEEIEGSTSDAKARFPEYVPD